MSAATHIEWLRSSAEDAKPLWQRLANGAADALAERDATLARLAAWSKRGDMDRQSYWDELKAICTQACELSDKP